MKTVLIYRLGSLGDTIVALPLFKKIAEIYPKHKRYVLTNYNTNIKASHTSLILDGSGLVDGYISYPVKTRSLRELNLLKKKIQDIQPEVLIYLASPRGRIKAYRDAFFFRWCGIRKLIGIPYTEHLQKNRWLPEENAYEYETERLVRCLSSLGKVDLENRTCWDLNLTENEVSQADKALGTIGKRTPFIVCSPGAKVDVKNWGEQNWSNLVALLYGRYGRYALVCIGAASEHDIAEEILKRWKGLTINLCGKMTPRESAAVLEKADLFIGHDSGPMHLSASVGTPCMAIFSGRNLPRVWYPYGKHHRVIYHEVGCNGCELEVCEKYDKKCIMSIGVNEVLDSLNECIEQLSEKSNSCD